MDSKKLFDLSGKLALVTGASRGIGMAIASRLLEEGAKVVITARGTKDLNAVAERIMDDPVPMTEDQIANALIGLSELHETRMWKLWKIFETIVHEKGFKDG